MEKGFTMKRKFLFLLVLAVTFLTVQNASAVMIMFEDLPLNQVYNVGDSFTSDGINIQVVQFVPVNQLNASVKVDNLGIAGGSGNEISMTNASLQFTLNFGGYSANGIAFMFTDQDGGINLGVNGDVKSAANFSGLPATIGGANVYLSGGYPFGIIMITGSNIQSVVIGGQKISIDNVLACKGTVPEPVSILLLGLGGLGLLIRKKKKG